MLTILYNHVSGPTTYALDSDPATFGGWGGTNAEAFSTLIRTDTNQSYYKSGPGRNDWTPIGVGVEGDTQLNNHISWGAGGAANLNGVITPAALPNANVDDYSPPGLPTANTIRLLPSIFGSTVLTGLAAGVFGTAAQADGTTICLVNVSPTDPLTINAGGTSSVPNRFLPVGGAPFFTIPSQSSVFVRYDGISTRWRFVN